MELVKITGEIIPLTKPQYELEEIQDFIEGYYEITEIFQWRFLVVNEDGRNYKTGQDLPVNPHVLFRLEQNRQQEHPTTIPNEFNLLRDYPIPLGNVIIVESREILKHYF